VASNGSRPLLGITSYLERATFGVWDVPAALLARDYLDGIVAAGGVPVLLPPVGDWGPAEVSRVDGLVLAGGPDIDPARYGAAAHPQTGAAQPNRDDTELRLANAALTLGVPVLGVCRGMQLLNVALGGTLRQHLPQALGNTDHLPERGTFGQVDVRVSAGSRLAGIVGERLRVSCHHHQGVDRLGRGLRAVAWARDGLVEAVELPGEAFVLGVQWHPENDRADVRLFKALVRAARAS
jgi:putative glutamine amidotransferase